MEASVEITEGGKDVSLSASTDQIDAPLVFQCKKCNVIVSDSFAFQVADEDLRVVIVHTACNVSFQANSLITSKKGVDIGSTFLLVNCATPDCRAPLGRLYKTTARHLDHIREMFTFDVDAIKSYKLGSCPSLNEFGSTPSTVIPTVQHMQRMEDKLLKMQHLLLVFHEKLTGIEKYLGMDPGASSAPSPSLTSNTPPKAANASTTTTSSNSTTSAANHTNTNSTPSRSTITTTPTATSNNNSSNTSNPPKAPTMSTPTTARPPTKFASPGSASTTSASPATTTSTSTSLKRDYIGLSVTGSSSSSSSSTRNVATTNNGTAAASSSIPRQTSNSNNAAASDPKRRKK